MPHLVLLTSHKEWKGRRAPLDEIPIRLSQFRLEEEVQSSHQTTSKGLIGPLRKPLRKLVTGDEEMRIRDYVTDKQLRKAMNTTSDSSTSNANLDSNSAANANSQSDEAPESSSAHSPASKNPANESTDRGSITSEYGEPGDSTTGSGDATVAATPTQSNLRFDLVPVSSEGRERAVALRAESAQDKAEWCAILRAAFASAD